MLEMRVVNAAFVRRRGAVAALLSLAVAVACAPRTAPPEPPAQGGESASSLGEEAWQAIWNSAPLPGRAQGLVLIETPEGARMLAALEGSLEAFDLDGERTGSAEGTGTLHLFGTDMLEVGDLSLPVALAQRASGGLALVALTPLADGKQRIATVPVDGWPEGPRAVGCLGSALAEARFGAVVAPAALSAAADASRVSVAGPAPAPDQVAACVSTTLGERVTGTAAGALNGPGWQYQLSGPVRAVVQHPNRPGEVVALTSGGDLYTAGSAGLARLTVTSGLSVGAPEDITAIASIPQGTPLFTEGALAVYGHSAGRIVFITQARADRT
jgi:hypothetical protein